MRARLATFVGSTNHWKNKDRDQRSRTQPTPIPSKTGHRSPIPRHSKSAGLFTGLRKSFTTWV